MRAGGGRVGRTAAWLVALVLCCGAGTAAQAFDRSKTEALEQAASGMAEALRSLEERSAAAAGLGRRLKAHRDLLRAEIARERQRLGVESYPQALRVERIGYNLRLIQRIDGYLAAIERRIGHIRALEHTLDFTRRSAQDELRLLKTLEDRDISELASRVGSVLEEVVRETTRPLLDAADAPSASLERVWSGL
jgi:hypothetical protein